jgi:hypothetical protein
MVNITVKCAPEKEEPENESDDDEPENESDDDEPVKMAKGGMVKAKKSIQLKGWGKARRR